MLYLKWKLNEKKKKKRRRKEAKRIRFLPDSNSSSSAHLAKALPLGHVEILLLKPSSLMKHEFKDIFQKNDRSLDSENPT